MMSENNIYIIDSEEIVKPTGGLVSGNEIRPGSAAVPDCVLTPLGWSLRGSGAPDGSDNWGKIECELQRHCRRRRCP